MDGCSRSHPGVVCCDDGDLLVTNPEARRAYNQTHAAEPRHVDLTTFCVWVGLAVLGMVALVLVFAGALWVLQFSGGVLFS